MTADEIQQEIERTRGEMAGTLQAIEARFSPRQLMDQAVDTMRGLTGEQSRLGSMVRDNPLPLALIGLGIGWLALSGTLHSRRSEEEYGEVGVGAREPGWTGSTGAQADYTSAAGTGSSGYGAEGTQGFVPMGAGSMTGRAGDIAGQARRGIQRATSYTSERVSEWRRSAGSLAGDAVSRTRDTYQDRPFVIGVAAAMLGVALGALLPRTHWERRLAGGPIDNVMRQARETGGDLMERAGRVAKSAMRVARPQSAEEPSSETMH